MKFNNKTALLIGSLMTAGLITGCGGGGGGAAGASTGSQTPVENNTPDPTPTPDPVEETPVATTGDIVVPDNFNINDATSYALTVDLDLDLASNGGDAFISVCSEYTGTSPNFTINYGDCVVSETTTESEFDKVVAVSTATNAVVLAVWFPSSADPTNSAIVQEFTGLNSGNATVSYAQ